MIYNAGEYKVKIELSKDIKEAKISKKCYFTKNEYSVIISLDLFKELKKTNDVTALIKYTRNQRRFLYSYLTPIEFEKLKNI